MLTTECFRQCPLASNTSLNIQRSNDNGLFGSSMQSSSPFSSNSNSSSLFGSGVPLDRPIFVNTNMTAQQCVDLYQRVGGSSGFTNNEPVLQMRL